MRSFPEPVISAASTGAAAISFFEVRTSFLLSFVSGSTFQNPSSAGSPVTVLSPVTVSVSSSTTVSPFFRGVFQLVGTSITRPASLRSSSLIFRTRSFGASSTTLIFEALFFVFNFRFV